MIRLYRWVMLRRAKAIRARSLAAWYRKQDRMIKYMGGDK